MGDVDIFRAELSGAASSLRTVVGEMLLQAADLEADDVGIGNPVSRATLRLELHRRLTALHAAVVSRADGGSRLAADAQGIADRFTDLDEELTGRRSG